MLIIHAPSDALKYYKGGGFRDSEGHYHRNHPALFSPAPFSKLAASARQMQFERDPHMEPEMPVISAVGSFNCEDTYPDQQNYTVHRAPIMQHHAIKIVNGDVIANDYDVLEALQLHHITTVILMGVHTNLCVTPSNQLLHTTLVQPRVLHLCRRCVMTRPFGIRNLVKSGFDVLLARDLTCVM
jgi:hypothetical protein